MNKINSFLKNLEKKDKSPLTIKVYEKNLEQFCDIMSLDNDSLTNFNIEMFYDYTDELRKQYAISSINQKIGTLRSFYKFLYKHGYIEDMRYKSFEEIVVGVKLPQYLEMQDAQKIISTVRTLDFTPNKKTGVVNLRDRLILEILLDTGVRAFELEKMKISDINFATGETFVIGKGKVQRLVKISLTTRELIREWIETRKLLKISSGFEDFLIISSTSGQNLKKRQIQNVVKKYVGVSEVKDVSLHKLRHTYASIMLATGTLTPKQLQDRLGHKNATTTELYVHALAQDQQDNPLFA